MTSLKCPQLTPEILPDPFGQDALPAQLGWGCGRFRQHLRMGTGPDARRREAGCGTWQACLPGAAQWGLVPSGFYCFLLEEACAGLGREEMLPVQLSPEDQYS